MKDNKRALFLDRDGVINVDKDYVYKIEDFIFFPEIFSICRFFIDAGFLIIIVTNQSGIARNYYTEEDVRVLHAYMLEEFLRKDISITAIYYSPFHPDGTIPEYTQKSYCRKPEPGMLLEAEKKFGINLADSYLIGDKETDIEAGIRAGVKNLCMLPRTESERKKVGSKAKMFQNHTELLTWLTKEQHHIIQEEN